VGDSPGGKTGEGAPETGTTSYPAGDEKISRRGPKGSETGWSSEPSSLPRAKGPPLACISHKKAIADFPDCLHELGGVFRVCSWVTGGE